MSDDKLDRIEAKIDKIIDVQLEQAITLATNTAIVQEHSKRSDTLEDLYHHLDEKIDAEIEPLKASALKTKTIANLVWKVFIYVVVPLGAAVIATMHFIK